MFDRTKRQAIDTLAHSGPQPFGNLEGEDLAIFGEDMDLKAKPVTLSEDGLLIDGHQRLRALLGKGRKTIGPDEFIVKKGVTRKNAMEWAIKLNINTRPISVQEKADLAERLQREDGWSQGRIAKAMGVSRPAVSRWLEDKPAVPSYGQDGKLYPAKPKAIKDKLTVPHPWDPAGGYIAKDIVKLTHRIQAAPIEGLTHEELETMRERVQDLVMVLDAALEDLGAER